MKMGKAYFISDLHLGSCLYKDKHSHEKGIINFLDKIKGDCSSLWLLGDVFDFWYEYKRVVPKGMVRFLGKLCEFTDAGIEVHMFGGNHDMWLDGYLSQECHLIIHTERYAAFRLFNRSVLMGHGDGLDPDDKKYLLLNKLFHNEFARKCFRLIHPDLGVKLADRWSSNSKKFSINNKEKSEKRIMASNNAIIRFCKNYLQKNKDTDIFLFGHTHYPTEVLLDNGKIYINTGDWLFHKSYAVLDSSGIELKEFKES